MAAVISLSVVFSALSVCVSAKDTADTAFTASFSTDSAETIVGGWSVNTGSTALKKNPEAKKALTKALKKYKDAKIEPVAYLASQVVAGTNYCFICRTTDATEDARPEIKLVYVYADLSGNAEITGFQTVIGKLLPGGYEANEGKFKLGNNKTVKKALKKAAKGLAGIDYEPVAYLGSQVVAGSNYMILVRVKDNDTEVKAGYYLVSVYADLNGNAEINEIAPLAFGNIDEYTE